ARAAVEQPHRGRDGKVNGRTARRTSAKGDAGDRPDRVADAQILGVPHGAGHLSRRGAGRGVHLGREVLPAEAVLVDALVGVDDVAGKGSGHRWVPFLERIPRRLSKLYGHANRMRLDHPVDGPNDQPQLAVLAVALLYRLT